MGFKKRAEAALPVPGLTERGASEKLEVLSAHAARGCIGAFDAGDSSRLMRYQSNQGNSTQVVSKEGAYIHYPKLNPRHCRWKGYFRFSLCCRGHVLSLIL